MSDGGEIERELFDEIRIRPLNLVERGHCLTDYDNERRLSATRFDRVILEYDRSVFSQRIARGTRSTTFSARLPNGLWNDSRDFFVPARRAIE